MENEKIKRTVQRRLTMEGCRVHADARARRLAREKANENDTRVSLIRARARVDR